MELSHLLEKYIEKTGYGMDMWSKEENAVMTTIAEILEENKVKKFSISDVSGQLVDFLTWYIHKSDLSKDTYGIEFIVKEYLKSTNLH